VNDDEAVIYEDFFIAGLRMPLHPALADILLHFQVWSSVNAQCHHTVIKKILGSRQRRWHAFEEFVC
jgi:hypothetical protein